MSPSTSSSSNRTVSSRNQRMNWRNDLSSVYDLGSSVITQVIYIGFSRILRRREILSPKYFSGRRVSETEKIGCLTSRYPPSIRIVNQLLAAGEAVRMGYLDEIALVISDGQKTVEAIEVHTFKFQYSTDGRVLVRLSTTGRRSSSAQTTNPEARDRSRNAAPHIVQLCKSINSMCKNRLDPLPSKFSANFRVKYTDSAPADFEIDGFKGSKSFYSLPEQARKLSVGGVSTESQRVVMTCESVFVKDIKLPGYAETSKLNKQDSSEERNNSDMSISSY